MAAKPTGAFHQASPSERLEDGFRVERWHMGAPPPPFHKKVVRDAGPVDRRNVARLIDDERVGRKAVAAA